MRTYSLLLHALLTLLNINGHEYLSLPPHPDEGLKVGFTDPELPTKAVGDQVTVLNPAADGLGGDLQNLGRLADRH